MPLVWSAAQTVLPEVPRPTSVERVAAEEGAVGTQPRRLLSFWRLRRGYPREKKVDVCSVASLGQLIQLGGRLKENLLTRYWVLFGEENYGFSSSQMSGNWAQLSRPRIPNRGLVPPP